MEPNLISFLGLILSGLIFFSGNLLCQFIAGQQANIRLDYFQSLNMAFAGIILGFGFNLIHEIELINKVAFYFGLILAGITILSMLLGLLILLKNRDLYRIKSGFFILLGLFDVDRNVDSNNNVLVLLSRFTWELPQTFLGYIFTQWMNCFGKVGEVHFFAGASYCIYYKHSNRRQGVSIGNFIYINQYPHNLRFEQDPLLLHEYGHHLQSKRYGWLYLIIVGIPSLISALRAKPIEGGITTHDIKWFELQANIYAGEYLKKYYQLEWTQFEPPLNSFPRTKFRDLT